MSAPLKSTGRQSIQNWGTPLPIFRWANAIVPGGFTIDAAADAENTLLPRYWTQEQDALQKSWKGERPWWNPPFWQIKAWMKRAVEAAEDEGVMSMGLVPASFETAWFNDFAMRGSIFVFRPRPKYRFPKVPRDRDGNVIPPEKWPKSVEGPPITSMCILFQPGHMRPAGVHSFEAMIIDTRLEDAANEDRELPAEAEKAG